MRKEEWWDKIRVEFSKSPTRSIVALLLSVLIGASASALVNAVSLSSELLKNWLIVSFGVVVILIFNVFFVIPYWRFKWKYSFLEDEEVKTAQKLNEIKIKAGRAHKSFDGIIAIQLFKVNRHTTDEHVKIHFKKMFSIKTKRAGVSRLKNKRISIPIDMTLWANEPHHPFPDNGKLLNLYLYEYITILNEIDPNLKLQRIIEKTDFKYPKRKKMMGMHFITIFDSVPVLESGTLKTKDNINVGALMSSVEYNSKTIKHKNRTYHTIRFTLPQTLNDEFTYNMLIIANEKIIPKETVYRLMANIID